MAFVVSGHKESLYAVLRAWVIYYSMQLAANGLWARNFALQGWGAPPIGVTVAFIGVWFHLSTAMVNYDVENGIAGDKAKAD